jgi:Immunoglobulin-like domain of bacterial spore germination
MRGGAWMASATALAALLVLVGCSDSSSGGAAPGATSPGASVSPSGSGSPAPGASGSASPTTSASPATTGSPSATSKPTPHSSIADDGLPVVTIEQPTKGSSVNIPVQISGTVVAFEAVLRWEILDSKGKLFTNGPAYADAGAPERGHWEVEVELPIGSYTAVAFVESPKDGSRIAEARVKFRAG